jgi:hypothetical protein
MSKTEIDSCGKGIVLGKNTEKPAAGYGRGFMGISGQFY